MTSLSAPDRIRDVVARGDRRRRSQAAKRVVMRLVPPAAGLTLLAAILARVTGGSAMWPSLVAAVLVVSLGAYLGVRARRRRPTDADAAQVDRAADLGGELRSAYWFTQATSRDAWAAFHLDTAAARSSEVDWSRLYPRIGGARTWSVASALALGAVLVTSGVPGLSPTRWIGAAGVAGAEANAAADELQKRLDALLAAIEAGRLEADQAKASLDRLKDLMAKVDPALQKKIDELLKKQPLGADANIPRTDLDAETLAERAARDKASSGGLPEDVRWALEDLAARLANASAERQTAKGNPSASSETGEKGLGSSQAETMQATAAEAAMQMVREAAGDAAAAKMMMGGGGMMGGDSRSGAGGNEGKETGAADALLVAQALRKETVEAAADMLGANVSKEDLRRKTEQSTSSLGFTRAARPTAFERSRVDAPPPVPEARRDLVQKYFIRR